MHDFPPSLTRSLSKETKLTVDRAQALESQINMDLKYEFI